jgi:Lrp/AsnC family transcriptional regulator
MIAPPLRETVANPLDDIDRQILALLQEDASLPVSEIATRVGLSTTPCWKRIHKLKEDGVIARQVVLCDPDKLALGTTVFVEVSTNQHDEGWLESFAKAVQSIPEIVEAYRMSGDVDYLLRVVVADIKGYDAVYKRLIKACRLHDVSSSFAMERIKYSTALPLTLKRSVEADAVPAAAPPTSRRRAPGR